tara:strand:- start:1108 stop:2238 length:1131 start_codon:yes stop_codon:yes gene_type:complete
MKTVGIIVGINTDAIDKDHFPKWLKDIPDNIFNLSKEKWDKDYYGLSSDLGIAYYLLKKSKNNKNLVVSILTKEHINLETFNKFDYIFGLYDPYYYAFETKLSKEYNRYNNLIKNTKAKFIQPLSLQKFVINKKKYLTELKKNNIPVVDTIYFKVQDNMKINEIISKIEKESNKWNKKIFITKPQPGGFGIGFKKWDLSKVLKNKKSFTSYIKKIEKLVRLDTPYLLVQPFVPEFEKFYEVRTYWLNGKYSHSLGTIIDPDSLGKEGFEKVKFAYPKNEYKPILEELDNGFELIDVKLINELKKIGQKIIKILPKDKTGLPVLLRLDFGCCLDNKDVCRNYFLNEIEYVPNLFPEYNRHVDIMKRVGDAILKKINT